MSKCGIYKIINPNNKIYIGQSLDIDRRWIEHCKKTQLKGASLISRSIKKYGAENHIFEIIVECEKSRLNDLEIFYIEQFQTFGTPHGLNLTPGGENFVMSAETKNKISKANSGRKRTEETKRKISEAKKGTKPWCLGKKFTAEHKFNLSAALSGENNPMYGKTHSDEYKQILSERMFGDNNVAKRIDVRKKISKSKNGENNPNFGTLLSEETKQKMSLAHKGKIFSEEHKAKMSEAKKKYWKKRKSQNS